MKKQAHHYKLPTTRSMIHRTCYNRTRTLDEYIQAHQQIRNKETHM